MSPITATHQASTNGAELPTLNEFVRRAGKEPARYLELATHASFILHHLATAAVARDQAPWLRAIKDRLYRKYMEQLDLDDGVCRAVEMPEVVAEQGRLSHHDLLAASHDFKRPLIVRGWFADSTATKMWTLEGLTENAGSIEIQCVLRESTKFNQNRATMTVKEYCERVRRGEAVYLSGEMALLNDENPLLEQLELHRFDPDTRDALDMRRMYVFGGSSRGTGTAMHCGEYASVFVTVAGKKRWRMLRPDYTAAMNPIASKFYSRLILADGQDGCDGIEDLDHYWSQFSFLPHYVGDTTPGDLIVVPGWWWHHVENLGEELTLGVDLDTVYREPNGSRLLTYAVRADLSPIRRWLSPYEKNRLPRQGFV